jgi:hypothetical protein
VIVPWLAPSPCSRVNGSSFDGVAPFDLCEKVGSHFGEGGGGALTESLEADLLVM